MVLTFQTFAKAMASQSITPVASTSTAPDDAITCVESESTEKQTINIQEEKDEINYDVATWWLRMVEPRRAPYFPQKKDKIVYLRQAHEYYLKEVVDRKIFDVTESDKLWIDDYESLTVDNVSFKRLPTRVACLEVRRINKEGQATGPVFKLKYHDMEGVVDFLVLKHIFEEGLMAEWNVGDSFRYLLDNKWFSGTIVSIKSQYQKSPYKSFQIKWDDEEELDHISPWEIERIKKNRLPKNRSEPVEVLNIEIVKMRYKPCSDDWPDEWNDEKAKNIISEIDLLMRLPISKCFIEIKTDPIFDALVPYAVDLSTIRQRIDNHFYRRIDSLLLDIFYLKDNAEEYKSEKFFEEAKLIEQACYDILYKGEVNGEKLSEDIVLINVDDDDEYKIFGSCNEEEGELSYKDDWMIGCKLLLNILGDSEDMLPFRQPVCREDYPDYYEVISSPICFEEINTKFYTNQYKSQKEVFEAIELIITNSYKFNQSEDNAIYYATKGVEALFKELRKQINKNSRKKNKSIPSRREKQKNSNRKPNEETVVCQKEKEKNSAKIVTKQMDPINQKSRNQDVNTVDETELHSKNNNYTKDLSKALSISDNVANLVVQIESILAVTKPNKGKENILTCGSIKRKQLKFMSEHNSNESPKKKLHTSSVEISIQNLLNKVAEGNYKTNNSNNSKLLNDGCEMNENDSTNQFSMKPKSPEILQSQIEDSSDSFVLHMSDNEQEHQEAPTSCIKVADLTPLQNHSTENGDTDVNKSLQNNYNGDLTKASSSNGKDTNLAGQALNLAIIQIKEIEMKVLKKKIFKEEDSMMQELVQIVNEKNSNDSPNKNIDIASAEFNIKNLLYEINLENSNEDDRIEVVEGDSKTNNSNNFEFDNGYCEIIENYCTDQFHNESKSSQISQMQRTDSTESIIVIDSDNDDDEEYRNMTKSFIKTGVLTQSQAHCTESTNQFNEDPKSSQILQSQIEVSTDSFDLQVIKEEQDHQERPQSCNKADLTTSQSHSTENRDKDVNGSSQKKSNVKKSLASFKARKRMHLKYNRIFQHRLHKSCTLCQSIKRTYLVHLKSHHAFNTI